MFHPYTEPLMMPWDSSLSIAQAKIEMAMNMRGLNIIVPDFIMPVFDIEPFHLSDFWKPKANALKFRSIIRKHKQATTI